ncbi:MAG: serine/threonine protein kinase [Myxococcaceae bacterium]|nr:serine/threonine protein kinase [Myxococcaceae bacterium]
MNLTFASLEEEVRFLRGLVSVQRLADEVLEDCLSQNMGLAAALDIYLSQCARMIHARGAFVELTGTEGPVLQRLWGQVPADVDRFSHYEGAVVLQESRTLFVSQLELAHVKLGSIGFILPGRFEGGGKHVMELVDAIAEMLDSAVLGFIALSEGSTPLERLDELHDGDDFRPRARIGRYELVTPLGTGGMAQVLVARTSGPAGVGRLVALKRMLPHLTDKQELVDQFLDEAKLGLKLQHPNLVTVHDFGQAAGGGYFIAMELVRGVDFDQLIYEKGGKLSLPIISGVLCQALEGLHAAHDLKDDDGKPLGLVHRDLSPHNVMVGFDGLVKVLDFGVAKMANQRTVTLPGIVKGKPLYMSPEQAVAERVDRRSDLFSMGLIFYEALMGSRAFDTGNDTRTMEAIVNDPLPRPKEMNDVCWELCRVALAKRPDDRFRTALDFAVRLRELFPPASPAEIGRLARERFPRRVEDMAHWDRLAAEASRLRSKVGTPTGRKSS